MIRSSALALFGALAFTNVSQIHLPVEQTPMSAYAYVTPSAEIAKDDETLAVYYTPLSSTEAAKYAGFGTAYHMAIVYTDHAGRSYGATAIPSDMQADKTPKAMFAALLDMAADRPSTFGTLLADRSNNKPFVKGGTGDFYTHTPDGQPYPHSLVMRGKNLSAQWATIVQTYTKVSALELTYSPLSQNSNSLAGTALRRAGIGLDFSSNTYFTPGVFTQLP